MDITVLNEETLRVGDTIYQCAIGKGGFISPEEKREGDLKTPTGTYALREVWYRPDKLEMMPDTALLLRAVGEDDGWCDEPAHPNYNEHIVRPFAASHEKLWRDDDCYDLIVPIGYNDAPVVPGKGSAIFMHIAKPGYTGTEGCVAVSKQDLLAILPQLAIDSRIHILQTSDPRERK
jgi:L,D-peptidoglycan transpeptidase YkuD (ErfK/YbiS/YcfS/YnhG family)